MFFLLNRYLLFLLFFFAHATLNLTNSKSKNATLNLKKLEKNSKKTKIKRVTIRITTILYFNRISIYLINSTNLMLIKI